MITIHPDRLNKRVLYYVDGVLACAIYEDEVLSDRYKAKVDLHCYVQSRMPKRLEDSRLWC